MKKLLLLAIVVLGAFQVAHAVPQIGFYVFLLIALLVFIAIKHGRSGNHDPLAGSARTRTRKALRAVRKNHMTLAQASQHYGVPERSIARTHLLYFLFLD